MLIVGIFVVWIFFDAISFMCMTLNIYKASLIVFFTGSNYLAAYLCLIVFPNAVAYTMLQYIDELNYDNIF